MRRRFGTSARGRPSNRRSATASLTLAIQQVSENYRGLWTDPGSRDALANESWPEGVAGDAAQVDDRKPGSGCRASSGGQFHQPRLRRESFGELVQIDGSEHHWFEDRGAPCTLIVFIDDATGTPGRSFVSSRRRAPFAYFETLEALSDGARRPRRLLFRQALDLSRVEDPGRGRARGMTQFGRALS